MRPAGSDYDQLSRMHNSVAQMGKAESTLTGQRVSKVNMLRKTHDQGTRIHTCRAHACTSAAGLLNINKCLA